MIATIILLVLIFIKLGYKLAMDGKTITQKYSFSSELIRTILIIILFYYAGLFDKFN